MKITMIETGALTLPQKTDILRIWNEEYPVPLMLADLSALEAYLAGLQQRRHFLVTDETEAVKGWLFLFERDAAQWFAIILDHTLQGQGWGSILLNTAKSKVPELNGWVSDKAGNLKQDGAEYTSPLGFYIKNGFVVDAVTRLETPVISAVKIYWNSAMENGIIKATPADYAALTAVWEASVRATHDFLDPADIDYFKPLVLNEFLGAMEHLVYLKADDGNIAGFAGVLDHKIEMLFLHPDSRGKGIGKQLLDYAVHTLQANTVDVNEQNGQAVGFYQHVGFKVVSRSETDGMGKPYPLLHMQRSVH